MTDTAPAAASGVDLARVALRAALAAAKSAPRQRPRRTGASPSRQARSGGREPVALGAAVSRMIAEQGLETGAAGGQARRTVLSQWDAIAPELKGKVQAVRYDDATRTLHLRPCSPAYRTQLTLHQKDIVARVNAAAGTGTVSCLEILRPGTPDSQMGAEGPASLAPPPAPRPAPGEPPGPRARDPRYLEALAAHQQAWSGGQEADLVIRAKTKRQICDRLREPEYLFVESRRARAELPAELDRASGTRSSDAARARALQPLAAERADMTSVTPAAAHGYLRSD
ncbi:DciA family protein [Streptomyces anulatus]